ncbi:helix-turn-helix transcriptional regulator [Nonomuraea typhae]|uniref:helix-turn-helix transcriptional regulator n=1 Tax=Nonomuraea typhae TaxID=2603600 RepID=UPI0012FB21DD|nr:helix-turn-helix domain-containing protein [Nonomuraea typhae]
MTTKHTNQGLTSPRDQFADIALIDAEMLCELWGVEKEWIYDQVEKGGLPHIKLGRRTTRFSVPDLKKWMAARTIIRRGRERHPA